MRCAIVLALCLAGCQSTRDAEKEFRKTVARDYPGMEVQDVHCKWDGDKHACTAKVGPDSLRVSYGCVGSGGIFDFECEPYGPRR